MVAPSWEAQRDGEEDGEGEGGLMLRVEGVEGWEARLGGRREGMEGREGVGRKGVGKGKEEEMEGEGLEALRERWERGMEELRRVVGRE